MILISFSKYVTASQVIIKMELTAVSASNKHVGIVIAKDTKYGLLIIPKLKSLEPGYYGFHIHDKPDCGIDGKHAGGHLDPKNIGLHFGPYNSNGHLGDLPNIFVNNNGEAIIPVLAPKLTINDILNRSLVVHNKTDYYDHKSFTNSGTRIICGIIPKIPNQVLQGSDYLEIDVIH